MTLSRSDIIIKLVEKLKDGDRVIVCCHQDHNQNGKEIVSLLLKHNSKAPKKESVASHCKDCYHMNPITTAVVFKKMNVEIESRMLQLRKTVKEKTFQEANEVITSIKI